MHCLKVRSCLSAFSNNELTASQEMAVREHLASCAACRKEEARAAMVSKSVKEIAKTSVSTDFNARLMNRVAHERFAETRAKAYLPKNAPLFRWASLVPVVGVAAVLVVAVSLVYNAPSNRDVNGISTASVDQIDNSYQTVQPVNNPNMNASMRRDWSLRQTLAQSERMARLSSGLTTNAGFSNVAATTFNNQRMIGVPRGVILFQGRPVIRVYQLPNGTSVQEVGGEF